MLVGCSQSRYEYATVKISKRLFMMHLNGNRVHKHIMLSVGVIVLQVGAFLNEILKNKLK